MSNFVDTLGLTYAATDHYPVSLALWHWEVNGQPTPISGDKTATWPN